jgi:hypothetical protein
MLGSSSLLSVCNDGGSSVSMSVVGSRVSLAKPAESSVVMIYDCTKIVRANSATAIEGAATAGQGREGQALKAGLGKQGVAFREGGQAFRGRGQAPRGAGIELHLEGEAGEQGSIRGGQGNHSGRRGGGVMRHTSIHLTQLPRAVELRHPISTFRESIGST